MENVSGIRMMVRKAGTASSSFERGSFETDLNINAPTKTRTGAVAKAGTIPAKGARNRQGRKQRIRLSKRLPRRPRRKSRNRIKLPRRKKRKASASQRQRREPKRRRYLQQRKRLRKRLPATKRRRKPARKR